VDGEDARVVVGVVQLINKEEGSFSDTDVGLLGELCADLAKSIGECWTELTELIHPERGQVALHSKKEEEERMGAHLKQRLTFTPLAESQIGKKIELQQNKKISKAQENWHLVRWSLQTAKVVDAFKDGISSMNSPKLANAAASARGVSESATPLRQARIGALWQKSAAVAARKTWGSMWGALTEKQQAEAVNTALFEQREKMQQKHSSAVVSLWHDVLAVGRADAREKAAANEIALAAAADDDLQWVDKEHSSYEQWEHWWAITGSKILNSEVVYMLCALLYFLRVPLALAFCWPHSRLDSLLDLIVIVAAAAGGELQDDVKQLVHGRDLRAQPAALLRRPAFLAAVACDWLLPSWLLGLLAWTPLVGGYLSWLYTTPRALKLLHVLEARQVWAKFEKTEGVLDKFFSYSGLTIFKTVLGMLVLSHIFACFFLIAVENQNKEAASEWMPETCWEDWLQKYYCGIYWAFGTLTGNVSFEPHTGAQRVITLVAWIGGVFLYGTVLGSLVNTMANLDRPATEHRERMETIATYMERRGLSKELQSRVRSYCELTFTKYNGLVQAERELLDTLPRFLQLDVAMEVNAKHLANSAWFSCADTNFLREMALKMTPEFFLAGVDIIKEGEIGQTCYLQTYGKTIVVKNGMCVDSMSKGAIFGEIALVLDRRRGATIRARTDVECYVISKEDFDFVIEQNPAVGDVVLRNALARHHNSTTKSTMMKVQGLARKWSKSLTKDTERARLQASMRTAGMRANVIDRMSSVASEDKGTPPPPSGGATIVVLSPSAAAASSTPQPAHRLEQEEETSTPQHSILS